MPALSKARKQRGWVGELGTAPGARVSWAGPRDPSAAAGLPRGWWGHGEGTGLCEGTSLPRDRALSNARTAAQADTCPRAGRTIWHFRVSLHEEVHQKFSSEAQNGLYINTKTLKGCEPLDHLQYSKHFYEQCEQNVIFKCNCVFSEVNGSNQGQSSEQNPARKTRN